LATFDYDSDEELDAAMDDEQHALRLIEHLSTGSGGLAPVRVADMDEARVRAHQLLRGQMSNKRVASKSALATLESVDMSTLTESERSKKPTTPSS
jgi:hypothetical protein